jgi:hypothetical protein
MWKLFIKKKNMKPVSRGWGVLDEGRKSERFLVNYPELVN